MALPLQNQLLLPTEILLENNSFPFHCYIKSNNLETDWKLFNELDTNIIYEKINNYAKPLNMKKNAFLLTRLFAIIVEGEYDEAFLRKKVSEKIGNKIAALYNKFLSEWNNSLKNKILINKYKHRKLLIKLIKSNIRFNKNKAKFEIDQKFTFPTENVTVQKIKEYLNNFIDDQEGITNFLKENSNEYWYEEKISSFIDDEISKIVNDFLSKKSLFINEIKNNCVWYCNLNYVENEIKKINDTISKLS